MEIRKLIAPSVASMAMLMCGLFSSNAAHALPSLTPSDYETVATTILRSETAPNSGAWSIFVGIEGVDVTAMIPRLQAIYQNPTILKAVGKDWGDGKEGCHIDKATGTGATGIFISAPEWRSPTRAAFTVTFAACTFSTHINTYIFDHVGAKWIVQPLERGPMS